MIYSSELLQIRKKNNSFTTFDSHSFDNAHLNHNSPSIRKNRRRPDHNISAVTEAGGPQVFASSREGSYDATSQSNKTENDKEKSSIDKIPTAILVIVWFSLGIISIATSKILLSTYNLPPLLLTIQQLMIGMLLLRTLMYMQKGGGLQSVPVQVSYRYQDGPNNANHCENGIYKRKSSNEHDLAKLRSTTEKQGVVAALISFASPFTISYSHIHNQLLRSAIYFSLGFLLTNYGFSAGSAAFVETIKAAEPITSAATAVLWGIEQLVPQEVASLGGIVFGVTISTMGHRTTSSSDELGSTSTSQSLLISSFIVLMANLCFSFRGVHQKLFRSTPQGAVVDDINLQYRMQQIGCLLLIIPAILWNPSLPSKMFHFMSLERISIRNFLRYISICIANGVAFASYNLSSTTILSRISVVHHAALNCIRRVFAIVLTSAIFGLRITMLQISGILVSMAAFFSYIQFKSKKNRLLSRRQKLRRKWRNMIGDKKSKGIGESTALASSLPMGSADN